MDKKYISVYVGDPSMPGKKRHAMIEDDIVTLCGIYLDLHTESWISRNPVTCKRCLRAMEKGVKE